MGGALLQCSFGLAPSSLTVLPTNLVQQAMPLATIMDNVPMVNVLPFGMCNSLANPTVASATAAAMGALTPMPCIPNIATPWTPGSPTVLVAGTPVVHQSCTLNCVYGGVIQVTNPAVTNIEAK